MSQPVLFYSNRCGHCKNLLHEIAKSEPLAEMQKVCVEQSDRSAWPRGMKSVPTIAYDSSLYSGENAFAWVNKITTDAIAKQMQSSGSQSAQQMATKQPPQQSDGLPIVELAGVEAIGSCFASLSGGDGGGYLGFGLLDQSELSKPSAPKEKQNSKASALDDAFEKMMSARQNF